MDPGVGPPIGQSFDSIVRTTFHVGMKMGMIRIAHIRSRVSELQAAAAERLIEKTALDRAWVLTRLRKMSTARCR